MRYVQDRMDTGVTASEAPALETYVREVLSAVHSICREHRTQPKSLPRPSREAYEFFRKIDRSGISATGRTAKRGTSSPKALSVPGVVRAEHRFLDRVNTMLAAHTPAHVVHSLAPQLRSEVSRLHDACERAGGTPAELPTPSRRSFSLLGFLNMSDALEQYVATADAVRRGIERIASNAAIARNVRLNELGGIYRYRLRGADCMFRVSPGFMAGDDEAVDLLLRDALLERDDGVRKALHEFCQSEDFTSIVQEIEDVTAPPPMTRGAVYDLAEMCERIRTRMFDPPLDPPAALTWTSNRTYRSFGHYSSLHDRVTVSRSLDDSRVPRYAVEFVMYHELLHKRHGIGFATGRRAIHTAAFRDDERRFPRYAEARAFLNDWAVKMRRRAR